MRFHRPIMLQEVVELLDPPEDAICVDGTVGGGGHARALAERLGEHGSLVGIDRDGEALEFAEKTLTGLQCGLELIRGDWRDLNRHLDALGVGEVDAILLDLGVSSHQLDTPARGFSYHHPDVGLDMRMDREASFTAAEVVNEYPEERLTQVIREYGEERWASRIAQFIVERRPLQNVGELVDAIKDAIPASARRTGPHPARRTFQALRMEVNRELEGFEAGLIAALGRLRIGGRIAVISFHSLEDRPVKRLFRHLSKDCRCPPDLPMCACGGPVARDLTPRPRTASPEELEINPRAASAKLRALEITAPVEEVLAERGGSFEWR